MSRLTAVGFLSLALGAPLFAANDPAAQVESRDPRELFETAGQLLGELQSKPPAERTRNDYTRTIEAYREVYHVAPASLRADPSAYAVAQLTDQLGHQFHDTAVLQQAVKQYRFLLHGYPATKHYAESLYAIANIEAEDLNDRAAARDAYQQLLKRFPTDKNASEARAKLEGLDALDEAKPLAVVPAAKTSAAGHESEPSRPSSTMVVRTDMDGKPETKNEPAAQPSPPGTPVMIEGVRHWSTSEYTRIAIDLNQQVKYEVGEVPGPERVFFDLADAKILAGPAGKTFEINDGLVRRVRVALFKPHVTRVVIELSAPAEYTPFMLPNPWRIMIEVRPRQPGVNTARKSGTPIVVEPFTLGGATPGSVAQQARKSGAEESMVVVVPMKHEATSAKQAPTPVKATATEVAMSKEPRLSSASAAEVPHVSASTPESSPSRTVKISDENDSDSPTPLHKTPVAASSRSGDPTRPREAQPTSTGERSLTRALGLKIGRIVIDAGHGGHDAGAIGPTGYREKDLVLDVALRLGKLLERKMGAEVIYTRDDDTFIPLEERTNIANQAGADLFLSIHANFSSDTAARGVETYYLNFSASDEALEVAARENATSQKTVHELQDLVQNIALKEKIDESREFAGDVQHALWLGEVAKAPGLRNRGVKKAPFIVLIGAHMPSVLAEISFVSNTTDEHRLRTPEYRQRIAESLYRGISRYASGLSGVKFAATSPYKPSGQTVAGTSAHNP